MRDLYSYFFKGHGILPDALAKQPPILLFEMLNSMSKEDEAEVPAGLDWFYGG